MAYRILRARWNLADDWPRARAVGRVTIQMGRGGNPLAKFKTGRYISKRIQKYFLRCAPLKLFCKFFAGRLVVIHIWIFFRNDGGNAFTNDRRNAFRGDIRIFFTNANRTCVTNGFRDDFRNGVGRELVEMGKRCSFRIGRCDASCAAFLISKSFSAPRAILRSSSLVRFSWESPL